MKNNHKSVPFSLILLFWSSLAFFLFWNWLTRNRRASDRKKQFFFQLIFIAVNFWVCFFSVFKSFDVWMTMLMNHYTVHLILIASALNTYLVSGITFISLFCQFECILLTHCMMLSRCYIINEYMDTIHLGIFMVYRVRNDSTCWSKSHSFFVRI